MKDYFATLDERRQPWLDLDLLKSKFLALSADAHPDRVHNASDAAKEGANQLFAELNAAYNCLREPKSRLQHLLELELGARPKEVQEIAAETMDLFMEVGRLCREADRFIGERARVTSPVLKVELFERAQEWADQLKKLQGKLSARRQLLEAELQPMNAIWAAAPPAPGPERKKALPLAQLERLWRDFSYLARWSGQVQERIVKLSL